MSLKDKLTIIISGILIVTLIFIAGYLYLDVKLRIESENFRAGIVLGDMLRAIIISEKIITEKVFLKIPIERWDDVWNVIRTKIFLTSPVRKWCIFKADLSYLACSELLDIDILSLVKDKVFKQYFFSNEPKYYKNFFIYPVIFHNNNLVIVYQIPESMRKSISTPQKAFYLILGMLVINFFAIFITLRLLLQYYVFKPLGLLIDASIKIQNKDFNIALNAYERKDEIGQLIQTFSQMVDNIKNHNQLLEQKIAEITAQFEELNKELILSQRLTTTGIMVSGIAHEINNPLGALINAAYVLKNKNEIDNKTYDDYIKIILEGLFKIKDIVKRVLQFSPRYQKNIRTSESLAGILEDALTLSRYRATKKGITIENKITSNNDFTIVGNRAELQQVFLNLILNALDALEVKGSILKIYARDTETRFVRIYIEDDGPGIDQEILKNIFSPFFTTKEPGKGTGLGLYIAQYVITQHGGTIKVESVKDKGTRFIIDLPKG
ncbi:MAG: sensor histidine kinase [Planctomycetota bacterium]